MAYFILYSSYTEFSHFMKSVHSQSNNMGLLTNFIINSYVNKQLITDIFNFSVHKLRPGDIKVVAAVGDSLTVSVFKTVSLTLSSLGELNKRDCAHSINNIIQLVKSRTRKDQNTGESSFTTPTRYDSTISDHQSLILNPERKHFIMQFAVENELSALAEIWNSCCEFLCHWTCIHPSGRKRCCIKPQQHPGCPDSVQGFILEVRRQPVLRIMNEASHPHSIFIFLFKVSEGRGTSRPSPPCPVSSLHPFSSVQIARISEWLSLLLQQIS